MPVKSSLTHSLIVSANKPDIFDISANLSLNVRVLGHKPTDDETRNAQAKNKKTNKVEGLKKFEFTSISNFAQFLSEGHTLYTGTFPSVGVSSTSAKNVSHSWIIAFDFDFPSILLEEILDLEIVQKYAAIAHPSYRAVPENIYKFHLYFVTDRAVKPNEYLPLWKVLAKRFNVKLDESKKGANNLFFGSLHEPIIINETNRLPVDEFLAEAEVDKAAEKVKSNKPVTDDTRKKGLINNVNLNRSKEELFSFILSQASEPQEGITTDTLRHIWDNQLKKVSGDIIEAVKALVFERRYKLNLREANISEDEREAGVIMKLEGCNPFHPSSTGNGDSFVLCFFDNGLPPVFYDRSCTFKEIKGGKERNGGSIISYWKAINGDLYSGVDGGKEYQRMIHALCDELKIERFNFKSKINTEEIISALRVFLADKVFKLSWDETHFFHYKSQNKIWGYSSTCSNVYATLIKPFLEETFGLKVAESGQVIKIVSSWLKNHNFRELDYTQEEDLRYTPFTNGFFDLETKELIPEKLAAYNQHRITFDYVDVSDDDETIQRFKKYWGHWLQDNELGDLLLNWVILNAQRQAYRTGMMVGLVGDSGIGKSAFGALIQELFHRSDFAKKMPGDFLTSKNNSHATASLEGCYSVVLEELKGETEFTSAEKIKDFTGDAKHSLISVNPKGQKERKILLRVGITFNCEGTLVLKAKESGFYRRSVIIPVYVKKSKSEANGAESDYLRQSENLRKIMCWCQKQGTQAALDRFAEVAKSATIQNFKRDMRFENNLIAQFIDEMITITNNKADFLTAKDLWETYKSWCETSKHKDGSQQAFGREFRRVARSTDISEDFVWAEEFAEQTGQQRIPNDLLHGKAVIYFGMHNRRKDVSAESTKPETSDPTDGF